MYLNLLNWGWITLKDLNMRQFNEIDTYLLALRKKEEKNTK